MLKRLRHKIERKVASKQPIQFRYDLVVSSIEGLVMDTKEVEISVSWSRGGKRKKSTSWRLVYPGESCAYFDEELTQPGVTLYRDQKPPYVFEEKEYDIKVLAKYVELGQVVNQVIGSHVIDLAKFATSETNFTSNETFKIPLKYRGFTNNVASLKVIVKSCWLKNLSGKDMDQISESLTQFSETSTSNYQSAMTHLPEQSQQQQPQGQQSKTPLSAQSSASSHKPLEVEKDSVSMYSGNSFKSDRLGNAMKADSGRSKRDQEGVAEVARTCESTIDTILDDFGKFNFEVDGKIDELLLSAQSAEKKLEKIKKKVGNVHQLKSQMKLLEDAKEARDSKFNEELEKANKQIEFLKQETLISETRVGNLKKAMQEKEAELQQYKEKAKNAQEQLPPSEEQREKSSLATDRGSKENEEWSLKVNTLIQQVQNLEAELDAANTKLAQAPMPVGADSRADNMELNRKVKKLEDELLNKEEELEDYELTVGSLKAQIAAGAPQENAEQEQSLQREKLMSLEQELAAIKQQKEFAEKSATDLQQSVKELEGKLSEQTQEVASSNQNVASLTAQIASLTQANDAVDGNVSALKQAHEEELKKLQSEVDALQQGRDGHNESLAELEKHFESEKELTAKLQNTISALEEDVSTKSESLQESLLKVGTLTATIESLTEERDGMVANASQAGDSVSELQAKLDSEKSLASDLQKSLETLEEKLSHKEEELEDYELTVGSLKAQVAALSSTVLQQEQVEAQQENAEQEQSLQREKLMSLEQELAAIKQQKEAAEKSATDLQQSVKELEGKLSEQTQEVASSNQNVASLTAQIASLTQANDAVDGNVSALKQAHEEELKKLQSEVDALQQGRDGHNESLAELEKHFESEKELTAKLQNTISALEEDVSTKSESLQESLLKVGTLTATIESLTEERDGVHSEKLKNLEKELLLKEEEYQSTVESLKAQVAALSKTPDVAEQPASGSFEEIDIGGEKPVSSDDTRAQIELKDRVKALEEELTHKKEQLSHKEEELEDYELTVGSLKSQLAALSSQTTENAEASASKEALQQDLEKQQKENDLEVAALKARVGELEAELQFMTLANEEEKSTEKVKPVEESAPEESSLCVNAKEMEKEKDAMLAELIKQKTQLQEENSFLIGELTEAKIELAEMKMR